jgi:glycosyltransferase involved in cell wall biosynthesis
MDTRDLTPPGGSIRIRLRVLFERIVSRLADSFADGQTAITPLMAELVHIPQKQLWGTWPSGVNLDNYNFALGAHNWPKEGDPIELIYIGALLHVRNLIPLCRAVEAAHNAGMDFTFSLYGNGAASSDLEEYAKHTSERIRVNSPVPRDQIPHLLLNAHVGVVSLFSADCKIFQASSPIKLFEYMAAGLPILAVRMACHSDVIGNGKFVFWVEQADEESLLQALRHIWKSASMLESMGAQAASSAADWTWQASALKLKSALGNGMARAWADE